MQGIYGLVGKALIELEENGIVTIEGTEEIEASEIAYYVEEMAKGLKAGYKLTERIAGKVITLEFV